MRKKINDAAIILDLFAKITPRAEYMYEWGLQDGALFTRMGQTKKITIVDNDHERLQKWRNADKRIGEIQQYISKSEFTNYANWQIAKSSEINFMYGDFITACTAARLSQMENIVIAAKIAFNENELFSCLLPSELNAAIDYVSDKSRYLWILLMGKENIDMIYGNFWKKDLGGIMERSDVIANRDKFAICNNYVVISNHILR